MPHVLTLVEQFWHKVPGGTAKATERTIAALLDRDEFAVSGLAARHGRARQSDVFGAIAAPPTHRIPGRCPVAYSSLPRPVLYESWLRLGRPSIDHLMGPESVFWASSLVVAPTRRPVVSTVHDLDFLLQPEFLSRRGRSFFPRMWSAARSRTDLFVCPSDVVAERCRQEGVAKSRITVVPWGIDQPTTDKGQAQEVLAQRRLPSQFVLLVAPDQPRKNPEGCAAALVGADCPGVIVGSSALDPDPFHDLGVNVIRLGTVSEAELSALYHRADALLFPSHAEGFGLPVLEAMAHATPVVTSRRTGAAEAAGGAAVLVDANDHDDIAHGLQLALTDGDERERLIAHGLLRAGRQTWANTAKGYAEAFWSVL
jgi:glycosyltransferase involved in cell wall biosynthesis